MLREGTKKEPTYEEAWRELIETRLDYTNIEADDEETVASLLEDIENMLKHCPHIRNPLGPTFIHHVVRNDKFMNTIIFTNFHKCRKTWFPITGNS